MRVRRNRLLGIAILALLALAVLAPAGLASVSENRPEGSGAERRAAQRESAQAERQSRKDAVAQQRAEARARRQQQIAENKARNEERRTARAIHHGHKTDANAEVSIDCNSITVRYFGFRAIAGQPNTVLQMVELKRGSTGLHIVFPARTFSFEGTEATDVITIAAPVGLSTVDLRSRWDTNELKGGFDIHQSLKCEPNPSFAIEKLQSLGGSFTGEPLAGAVGQTVLYEMAVTNTGNTPLTFSDFSDTVCDPGTISGLPARPIEPLERFTVVCAHEITPADAAAGSLVNVAKVTGTPEAGEGSAVEHESNRVVVTLKAEEKGSEEPKGGGGEKGGGGGENPPTPKSGVLGTSGASSTSSSKSGVLGFASATVPSLRGPQGCVRGGFTVSVKSAGVKSVVFYLDGRRLRTLGAANARKGLISLRIDVSKLKFGPHRVKATITMKPVGAGGKAAKASRSLIVVRCHSAVISPHFTG